MRRIRNPQETGLSETLTYVLATLLDIRTSFCALIRRRTTLTSARAGCNAGYGSQAENRQCLQSCSLPLFCLDATQRSPKRTAADIRTTFLSHCPCGLFGTRAVIGLFGERNVVRMSAAVLLGERCVTSKKRLRGRLLQLTSHRGLFPALIMRTARETFGPAGRATSKSSNLRKVYRT